nr:MAG TPA: hypothetical protein [Caudoviricetes sp.]
MGATLGLQGGGEGLTVPKLKIHPLWSEALRPSCYW